MNTGGDWGQAEQADYTMDTGEYTRDDLGGGGETVDKEGTYHFEITDVVKELDTTSTNGKDKSPCLRFDMLVLETVKGQSPAGSRHFHRVYVAGKGGTTISEGAKKNALRFGLGLGLLAEITKDDRTIIVDKLTGLPKIPLSLWDRAKGMQCIAKIKLDKGDGKYDPKHEIPFSRVYQVNDPAVADVPKNAEALAMLGGGTGAGAESGSQAKAKTQSNGDAGAKQKTAPAKQTVPPADDDLSDL
ncbi:MAG TPA: hypothetical protein VG713_12730 [Pirellulales bacterium]|nr:hypothetical protein [Pirellulales bacterium]